jgi:hypothetical protein
MEDAGFSDTGPPREPEDDGGLGARLTSSALARAGFPAEAAAATIDAELAKRDNGSRRGDAFAPVGTPKTLSVDPDGAPLTIPVEAAAPSTEGEPEPSEASGTAEEPSEASQPPETEQGRPRPARSRRRPPGDDARLV